MSSAQIIRRLNSKTWWKLIKGIVKTQDSTDNIPTLETEDNCIVDDEDKAQAFNRFFINHSTIDDENMELPNERNITNWNILDSIEISEEDVHDQLINLDITKALGPDSISPKLLKKAAKPLSKILQYIFNLSLKTSIFPAIWKKANVVPLYKKGDKSDINNYRPVSLLSVVAKVFERIIYKYVFMINLYHYVSITDEGILFSRLCHLKMNKVTFMISCMVLYMDHLPDIDTLK